jgi:hypothetical protein
VESAKQQNKLFQVLQQGNETLKQLQKEVHYPACLVACNCCT